MPSKKIKISELPLVESLKGLYTIGYKIIDGIKTSVKVSLEDIQTAYQDVVNAVKNSEVATKNANTAASNANEKAVLADTAAANANDTAEHPTYIGQDHYVYKWNKTAQAYDKTDIYTKGDAFSIKKVYASVANMEADKSNPDITEGDFVLVNTGDVEDPDNAKLYVKADGDFEFLVDMSGAIGFTGKTPQFSMGTISTLEAGATATATISEDGVDSDGNPKYKINFAIPRGNPGAPFRIAGEYATLEALKSAVPDGSAVDGFMAVGTEAPYDYYAWVNGDWVNQGKIAGAGAYIFSPTFISGAITEKDYNGLKEAIQSNMIVVCDTGVPLSMLLGAYTPIMEPTASYSNIGFLILSTSTNGILSLYVTISAADRKISTENKTALWSDKVLAKDNTTQFIPTGDYQPATKKYVDDKTKIYKYDNSDIIGNLLNAVEVTGDTAVIPYINSIFGNEDNCKDIILRLARGEISSLKFIYEFEDPDTHFYSYRVVSSEAFYIYIEEGNGEYELQFTTTDMWVRIDIVESNLNNYKFIVKNLVSSDNITTLTKKSTEEYAAITNKDANTAYCVTN